MREAAKNLDFELATVLRDEIRELEKLVKKKSGESVVNVKKIKKRP
jgi:excinuclease UvrABC nuclease subunit